MWRKFIAIGVVGVAVLVVLACSNAAVDETKTLETATPAPTQPADDGNAQPGAGGGVFDSQLANGSLPAGTPNPAPSNDPAVSGPADAPAYANDLPLMVTPSVRDLPQTDPYDPANPAKPNSTPPPIIDGGAGRDPGTPPELRKPIDRGTGKPLDPDGSVSSPPNPGVNVPQPVPSVPTQPGLVPLPAGSTRVLAPIDDADIVVRESFPPQYSVEIMAGLPGGCAKQAGYEVARSGTTFRVSVYNAMPSSPMICTAIYGMYRVGVALDNITSGTTYTVIVNDKTLTFTAQ